MKIMLTSRHLGEPVSSYQGMPLGKVVDFVVDEETATLSFAVLAAGQVEETGERLLIVPWPALSAASEGNGLLLGINRERLRRAPALERSELDSLGEKDVRAWVLSYYGFPSARSSSPEEKRLMGRPQKPRAVVAETDIGRLLEAAAAGLDEPEAETEFAEPEPEEGAESGDEEEWRHAA
jgi:hypothetical protein